MGFSWWCRLGAVGWGRAAQGSRGARMRSGGTVCPREACEHGCVAVPAAPAVPLTSTAERAVPGGSHGLSWHLFGCSPGVRASAVSGQITGSQTGGITVGEVDLQPWRGFGLVCKGDCAGAQPVTGVAAGKARVMPKDLHPLEGCPAGGLLPTQGFGDRTGEGMSRDQGLWRSGTTQLHL